MKNLRIACAVAGTTALVASFALFGSGVYAAPPSTPTPGGQGRLASPDTVLGSGWKNSSDVLVTGIGDTSGFHLFVAKEKDAFAWSTLATLTDSALDLGPWTGEVCVTGSGRYAVAVYAPAMAANRPALEEAGAMAAVVDTTTGKAKQVAVGVQLAYFNPGCGAGDTALLTRAVGADEQQTDLLTVDAATAKVTSTVRVNAQLTTPVPTSSGAYGMAKGSLVKVSSSGAMTVLAQPAGQVYGMTAINGGAVDLVAANGETSTAQRFSNGKLSTFGTGPRNRLQLFGVGSGMDALVGDTAKVSARPDLKLVSNDKRVRGISRQGHLLLEDAVTAQATAAGKQPLNHPDPSRAGTMKVTVRATHGGARTTTQVTTGKAPTLNGNNEISAQVNPFTDPSVSTPSCAVPRNDPMVQAFQPSANMVEWAVDQAVSGSLTVTRPADYLKTGQPAYTPQSMFPLSGLAGGGSVPAQVMLGILAQESNLSEASWHAVPGDDGNPLIADYYGNGSSDIDAIDYDASDCGYGIGQVTDNMHTGDTGFNHAQQVAVATDYAANIAAGLNILVSKWNQIYTDTAGRSYVNNGSPSYVENWWLAVWAYNSGYHDSAAASDNDGHWGVGWLNNPANPAYPADRDPFLRDGYGDASHPSDWSYEERVMGWVETPQLQGDGSAYAAPAFGSASGGELTMPGTRVFCSTSINNCDPTSTGDPCPAESDACWWHGQVTFANCASNECATQSLSYATNSTEPAVRRAYDQDCETFTGANDTHHNSSSPVSVVYDLDDNSRYALGCSVQSNGGKFTLRLGAPAGADPAAYYGQIDLHQLGAGYDGHMWFTHVYPPNYLDGTANQLHQVVATWTPEVTTQNYDVVVHLPSHGAVYDQASYHIYAGKGEDSQSCVVDQSVSDGSDVWVYLGNYPLGSGARVELSNIGDAADDGSTDIAFDAMAFVPTGSAAGSTCGDSY